MDILFGVSQGSILGTLLFNIFLICQGWTNFFLGARFFDRARETMVAQNQSARPMKTQLEKFLFALYYLNSTYSVVT